ncbi:MAG: peptidyl-prolyl cis-trans isomerase D [Gammaproteobacteria bacterium]|jgi:peptidyl-prolyl cis-trans isomerase D
MLQLIRDRSQGLVVGVIVFFICLTFALFGVQQYLDSQSTVVVAEVNGTEIGLKEYQRAFQQLRQRAQAMLGESFDSAQWSGSEAKLSALDFVVNESLLRQVVEKANIRSSDLQVASYIRNSPQFKLDGEFSEQRYQQAVRIIGFSELGFEQQVRQDLVVNQLRAGIGASALVTAEELQRLEQLREQTRDIGYAIFGIESLAEQPSPSSEEIAAYFDENSENYRIEEKVSISYVDLSIDSLMAQVIVNESKLRLDYETNRANYVKNEQRNANHILIEVAKSASAQAEESARERATQVRALAVEGGDFEELAKEHSDDIGSKTDGGETGFFSRGVMTPEFETAVFEMSEGDISEPVRSEFGFHVIRLKAISPSGIKSFQDARSDVEKSYRREQAENLFFEQAEELGDLAYEHPDSLDVVAATLDLAIKRTDPLSRSDIALMFSEQVTEAAFEPEVLLEGLNSAPIEVSNNRIVVVRLAEHAPSRVPPLDDVRTNVTKDFSDAHARDVVHAHGQSLVERLNKGEDLTSVMSDGDLKWEQVDGVTQNSPKINRAIMRTAFKSVAGGVSKAEYVGVPIGISDFGIVGISNVVLPPVDELSTSEIGQLRREASAARSSGNWLDFMELLKSDSKIETYPDRL